MATQPQTIGPFIEEPGVPVEHASEGPLAGLTFAVKDIYDVAGYVTGCGNPTKRAENPPAAQHASIVANLLAAGARFAGKTHTVELAFGMDGHNDHYGTPLNPASPDRVPGGSSSGSVSAVGQGMADFGLGSDTGGSVRAPASFCGQLGLRTTHGRIALDGTMPLAASLDTAGWFARTADIYERVGAVLLGDDHGPTPTRAMIATDAFDAMSDDATRAAMGPAIGRAKEILGAADEVRLASDGLGTWRELFRTIQGFEAWGHHGAWIEAHGPDALSAPVRERFEVSHGVSQSEYDAAQAARTAVRAGMADLLGEDGVIIMPTMPGPAAKLAADAAALEAYRANAILLTCASGLSGFPQISIPLAEYDGGPMGLSLLANAGRDRALIGLARRILDA